MTKDCYKKIHLIYSIILSALLVAVAIVSIVMCVDIYNSPSESPFTRESIYEHFVSVSAIFYACIGFIIGGAILNIVAPIEPKKETGKVKDSLILHRLISKLSSATPEALAKIEKHHLLRLVFTAISFVLLIGATITSLAVTLTTMDPKGVINAEVIYGTLTVLRFFALPFVFLIFSVFYCKYTIKKDLEIVKKEFKIQKNSQDVSVIDTKSATFTTLTSDLNNWSSNVSKPSKLRRYLTLGFACAILVMAVIFVFVGIGNDGDVDVYNKAVAICKECIGMG